MGGKVGPWMAAAAALVLQTGCVTKTIDVDPVLESRVELTTPKIESAVKHILVNGEYRENECGGQTISFDYSKLSSMDILGRDYFRFQNIEVIVGLDGSMNIQLKTNVVYGEVESVESYVITRPVIDETQEEPYAAKGYVIGFTPGDEVFMDFLKNKCEPGYMDRWEVDIPMSAIAEFYDAIQSIGYLWDRKGESEWKESKREEEKIENKASS